ALSEDARGVVAVIDIPETPALTPTVKDAKLVLATANIQDPGNVGAIIRAADVAGCDAVLLGRGSVELWSPKVIRSSAGS
ncbi:TrmH family RNA methyltransferase, partial [Actinomyces urogenitalis]